MKTIIALICVLSLPAFAGNVCSQSWETIDQKGYATDFPKIQFGTTWVSVDGVCVSGDSLFTQKAVEICTGWGNGEASDCAVSESHVLSTPITYTKEIPSGEGSFETIVQTHALNYSIPVGRWGEAGIHAVCEKAYRIPNCQ